MHLTDFSTLTPAYFNATLDTQLKAAYAQQARVAASTAPATWENVEIALQAATEPLGRTWGLANHLQSVCDTPELRACVNEWLPKITAFYTQLGQDLRLMAHYEVLSKSGAENLSAEQTKVVENSLRGFVLSGAQLPEAHRKALPTMRPHWHN